MSWFIASWNFSVASLAIGGRHIADRAVQTAVIVIIDETFDQLSRFFKHQRHALADAILLDDLMPTLDLAVALRGMRSLSFQYTPTKFPS